MSTPSQNTVKMFFVGHNVCFVDYNGYGHQFNASSPVAMRGLSLDLIRSMVIADDRGDDCELITAIHEFGHMFGVTDHYLDSHPPKENTEPQCIYGNNKDQITDIKDIDICPACDAQITENIRAYSSNNDQGG